MKIEFKDIPSIIDMIRSARSSDLLVMSLFLLPPLLGLWAVVVSLIPLVNQSPGWEFGIIVAVFAIYLIGTVCIKLSDTKKKRLNRARNRIARWLLNRRTPWGSFDAVRSQVEPDYTDQFLTELINTHRETFHHTTGCSEDQRKIGIALNAEELDDQHESDQASSPRASTD